MRSTIVILLCLSLILTGCYSYRDVDTIEFVTDFLIDMDENKQIILYTRANKGIRTTDVATESTEILMFKQVGATIFEAIRNMTLYTSSKLNYTQMRAIMMTDRAVSNGIDYFIDFIERDQELNLRARLYIFRGDPLELLNLDIRQEDFLGLYLWDVIQNAKHASKALAVSLNEMLNASYSPSSTYILPIVQIIDTVGRPQLAVDGSVIMDRWQMVGELTEEEVLYYSFLNNKVKSCILSIPNPQNPSGKISFEILKSKTKTSSKYQDGTLYVTKKITSNATIGEVQKGIIFNKEVVKELEETMAALVTEKCTKLFNEYRRQDQDIISVQNLCELKYPQIDSTKILPRTILNVETEVNIKGSSNIIDFKHE